MSDVEKIKEYLFNTENHVDPTDNFYISPNYLEQTLLFLDNLDKEKIILSEIKIRSLSGFFSVRALNCLMSRDIEDLEQLSKTTKWELLRTRLLGIGTLKEIEDVLYKNFRITLK